MGEENKDGVTRCRHDACTCEIPEGQKFCSPFCESGVAKSLSDDPCKCGHPACVGARSD
jgi:hypothetical protein